MEGKKREKNPQNTHLTATTLRDGEVEQTLVSDTCEWGLGREAGPATSVLRVRTWPECPEDNLGEIM